MTVEYWILRDDKLREQARDAWWGGKESYSYEQRRTERIIFMSRINQHHAGYLFGKLTGVQARV